MTNNENAPSIPFRLNNEGCPPERPTVFTELTSEQLYELLDQCRREERDLQDYRRAIERELLRRALRVV